MTDQCQKVNTKQHKSIRSMSTGIQQTVVEWIKMLGLESELVAGQIQSGRLVGKLMKITVPDYNLQLLTSNSAVNRVSNWNNLVTELKKLSIKVSQQDKNKIVNGNHDIVFQILSKLYDYYNKNQKQTEVDISKINPRSQVADSSSLLELFILTIIKYFNLSAKESVALLSSECKYLAHILVKGLKGDFKPIQGFVSQLGKHTTLIISFCKNRQNQVFFIRAVKPTLISKSEFAAQKGLLLLASFLAPLSNKSQIVKEYLLSTLILSIRRHSQLVNEICQFALENTNINKQILIMFKTEASDLELQNIFMAIFDYMNKADRVNDFLQLRGVDEILTKSVQSLKNSESVVNSMNLLLLISSQTTDPLSDPQRGSKFVQLIQQVNIAKKNDSIIFIQQLFGLLQIFGKDKNQIAPTLFKILIFRYQTCLNLDESRVYAQNFKWVLSEFPTIPSSLIVEALNNRVQANTLTISQIQLDLLHAILNNDATDLKSSLIIYNIISRLLVQQPAFVNVCTEILLSVIRKFQSDAIIFDLTAKLVKICLAMHFANVKRLSVKKRAGQKVDPEEYIQKSKNLGLEEFMYKLCSQGFQDLNKSVEPLVCYSLIQIEHITKDQGQGLRRILALFGDTAAIIQKYSIQASKLEEEENNKSDLKKSKINKVQDKSRYAQESRERGISQITSSDEALKNIKVKSKLDPMSLSQMGVAPAAMRGLEKYHKTYLNKLDKAQQQQNKKKQDEQRQVELKKIFQRKMLQKGIEVKKVKDEEFQYIYEFGAKQREIQNDTAKHLIDLPFYHPDHEQQRDSKGVEYALKKYQKVLKVYYNVYSGHLKPQTMDSFDQIAQKVGLLYSANLWKLIKDHSLDDLITVRQVQYLSKKINHSAEKKFEDSTALDFDGFQTFIVQASILMFTRPPKDLRGHPISEMIEETISRLKLYASDNRINEKLFEDPDNIFFNQTEAVKELNRKLEGNPQYILPEGYKKVSEKKVIYTHRIFLDAMSASFKDIYQIIDQILQGCLDTHIIEPFTTYETISKARPNLYYFQRQDGGDLNSEKLSAFMKKEVSKIPIKDRQIAKNAALTLDQIVEAVEFGHDRVGLKYENKLLKDRKMQQQQQSRKQQQEKKKWQNRNRQIKNALVKQKQIASTRQEQENKKKEEDKRKIQEQKKRKQQQEQRLKKKVQSYQTKKQEDEERRKEEEKQKKIKQKQDAERKKKQSEQVKRKIDQTKKRKQEQQNQKKKLEQMAQKQRKTGEKKKLEQQQKRKKELVEEYKNKKLSSLNGSHLSESPNKALDSSIARKKLV